MKGYGWAVAAAVLTVSVVVVLAASNRPDTAHGWFVPLAGAADDRPRPAAVSLPASGGSFEAGVTRPSGTAHGDADRVSVDWARSTAVRTGIPVRAVLAYSGASIALAERRPQCHLGWTTLAALGAIESAHGTHGGSQLGDDGVVRPGIFGPRLDGDSYAAVHDTDGGRLDGDPKWDRAVGPLQFMPSTWVRWGSDGNGDGIADPQQLDDAALAAGLYLCSYGDLSVSGSWRTAVFAYNHLDSYVASVAAIAQRYDRDAG